MSAENRSRGCGTSRTLRIRASIFLHVGNTTVRESITPQMFASPHTKLAGAVETSDRDLVNDELGFDRAATRFSGVM